VQGGAPNRISFLTMRHWLKSASAITFGDYYCLDRF